FLSVVFWAVYFINTSVGVAYNVWFLGRFGATPGKMACGLRVIRPDGEPITYWRALGRTFAEFVSQITLMVGYVIIAFDPEKRGLHDRICDTRVIRK
ncbi:MAG: RDD family protein, partial [Verrucomicrobiae bacterium]|nr:RDD family protein [Verrucomicrobiae bacterium]